MTTLTQSPTLTRSLHPLFLSALIGWLAALTGSLVIAGIAALLGIQLEIATPPNPQTPVPLTLAPIIFATLIPSIVATIFYAALHRFTSKNAARIFQIVAIAFALLSLGGPLGLPVAISVKIALSAMHIVAGGALVWALTLRK